jgi:hypothetical protein
MLVGVIMRRTTPRMSSKRYVSNLALAIKRRKRSAKHYKRSSKPLGNPLMSSKHLMSV